MNRLGDALASIQFNGNSQNRQNGNHSEKHGVFPANLTKRVLRMSEAKNGKLPSARGTSRNRSEKAASDNGVRRGEIYGFGESNQLFPERRQPAGQNIPHRTRPERIPRPRTESGGGETEERAPHSNWLGKPSPSCQPRMLLAAGSLRPGYDYWWRW